MNTYNYFTSQLAIGNMQSYVVDKQKSVRSLLEYNLIRLSKLFKVTGLPDTIPKEFYDRYLFLNGTCFLTEVKGDLYIFQGSFGGKPDPYFRPTIYIVSNPALEFSKSLDINKDGVLLRNDPLWIGMFPLLSRYSTLMAENILTLRMADIMLRTPAYLSAPDDKTHQSSLQYLKDLEDGKIGVIGENRFFEGIKLQAPPSSNGSYLTQFIELHQYYVGSFYNEIGLESNFNMKHEQLNSNETQMNNDVLLPLIDSMLQVRKEDFDKVNAMYGTNIEIDFDSSWKDNLLELQIELENLASQLKGVQSNDSTGTDGSITNGNGIEQTDISDNGYSDEGYSDDRTTEQDIGNDGGEIEESDSRPEQGESTDAEEGGLNINIANVNIGNEETNDGHSINVQINFADDGNDDQDDESASRLSTNAESNGDDE